MPVTAFVTNNMKHPVCRPRLNLYQADYFEKKFEGSLNIDITMSNYLMVKIGTVDAGSVG